MDLATVSDIACYMKLFPIDDGYYVFVPKFYVPEDNAWKREKKDRVPYIQWAKAGFITLTPGDVIDYSYIKQDLEEDWAKYNMQALAFDRWNFEGLRQQFAAEGIPQDKMIAFGQGWASLSAPSKEFEKLVISGKMIHNNNPVMRWMASNVSAEIDAAGNIKPSKKKSSEKIDGILAGIMALGQAITQEPVRESIYETRGLLQL
jgi:phage terminase large subunit-like protein